MKKTFAALAALLLAPLGTWHVAQAQDYPAKGRELKVVIGYPAGSGADTTVRFFTHKLSELSGQPVIVENRPGMLTSLAAAAVAKAPPDGYTILFNGAPLAANLALFKKVPYDPIKDFTPVTTLWRGNFILMIKADAPYRTVSELIEALRKKGSKASYGYGSPPALSAAELLKHRAGLQAVGISYKTAAASLPEMYSGALDFQFIDGTFALSQMRTGKLRGLATTGPQRSLYIDLPTMSEAAGIPDFDVSPWWAAFLPAGAREPVVAKLEGWLNQIVAMEETRKFLAGNAADAFPGNPKLLAEYLPKEIARWAELARLAGIQPQ